MEGFWYIQDDNTDVAHILQHPKDQPFCSEQLNALIIIDYKPLFSEMLLREKKSLEVYW